jgi:hypothetical protein
VLNKTGCAFFAGGLLASLAPVEAGPCTTAIDAAQAQADARIDAIAGAGGYGKESAGAMLHRQPTPGSVAEAEAQLGEGTRPEDLMNAITEARAADAAGDRAACERALAKIHDLLSKA